MKKILTFGLLSLCLSTTLTATSIRFPPSEFIEEEDMVIEHIYAPKGFDTNDNTQVAVAGFLPSTCHQLPSVTFFKHKSQIRFFVTAIKATNRICIEMQIPYHLTVNLGMLEEGTFKLMAPNPRDSTLVETAQLTVEKSQSTQKDNYLYAHVHHVSMVSKNVFKLVGTHPSPCIELDQITVISNAYDTFSVLPIMKQVSSHCPNEPVPFEYEVTLNETLPYTKPLLHVRVMDGSAINQMMR